MTPRSLALALVLCVSSAGAQTPEGEIAGRLTDGGNGPLPGATVTATHEGQARQAVTDEEGRFVFRALEMGTYHVTARLEGFTPASGEITLRPGLRRAFLSWPLQVGCMGVSDYVILGFRETAPQADAILHVRVKAVERVLTSDRPDCRRVSHAHSIDVIGVAPGRRAMNPLPSEIFTEDAEAVLERGREYLVLVWSDGRTNRSVTLPIVGGVVVDPYGRELNGMPAGEALEFLGLWSQALPE